MKTSISLLTIGAAYVAATWSTNATGVSMETITTTVLTTYCPEATVFEHGGVVYTVTEATTLTITDCPCTIVRPVQTLTPTTILYTSCPPTNTPPAPPPNGDNNNGNGGNGNGGVVTVTNSNGGKTTVTATGQGNAGSTGKPIGGAVGGNGTAFTGEGQRVVVGAVGMLALFGLGMGLL